MKRAVELNKKNLQNVELSGVVMSTGTIDTEAERSRRTFATNEDRETWISPDEIVSRSMSDILDLQPGAYATPAPMVLPENYKITDQKVPLLDKYANKEYANKEIVERWERQMHGSKEVRKSIER